jgi:hypothetical protein
MMANVLIFIVFVWTEVVCAAKHRFPTCKSSEVSIFHVNHDNTKYIHILKVSFCILYFK